MNKKICILILCLMAEACGQHQAQEATTALNGDPATAAQMYSGPECAQFNKNGTLKTPGGCTREQWAEWHKTH